jgi:putative DNA primase/helicase
LLGRTACRAHSVPAVRGPRTSRGLFGLQSREHYEALQSARRTQTTKEFQQNYVARAGIEGTHAQAISRCGLRRCRYIGLAKTHLQHVITAAAVNLIRIADAPFPANEVVACRNVLLHVPTMQAVPHTPNFFSLVSLGYDYDADAPEPKLWLQFLKDVWPTDKECVDTLQEVFGLLLTAETKYQRIPYLLGQPGTGRGTIARVLTALVGEHNVASPSFASLARGGFALQPLVGKSVALMADVRYIHRDHADALPLLLSISGEDRLDVNRKNKDPLTNVRLSARFVLISNEIVAIPDPTGALKRRLLFIPVEAEPKPEAEKDAGLTAKLLTELPSILNWALEGYKRLRERGKFITPKSAQHAIELQEDLASPIKAFLRDRCVVGKDKTVEKAELYAAWVSYCHNNGHDRVTVANVFMRDLYGVQRSIKSVRDTGKVTGVELISTAQTQFEGDPESP